MKSRKILSNPDTVFRKVPILVSKTYKEEFGVEGYVVEIASCWENWKPCKNKEFDFEWAYSHFGSDANDEEVHLNVPNYGHRFIYRKKKYAMQYAQYLNEKYLDNQAKIWTWS